MEEWKTINGTGNKYSVSNLGNVRRNAHYTIVNPSGNKVYYKERLLKPYLDSTGYYVVKLQSDDKKSIVKKIHRLVAEHFIENPNRLPVVNHIDENKTNNCVSNLEWCTTQYNNSYGNRNNKIKQANSKKIAQYSMDGKLIKIWDSLSQASQFFGATSTIYISRVCRRQFGRKSYKGFVWKYVDEDVLSDNQNKENGFKDKQNLIKMVLKTFSKEELYNIIKYYEQ